MVSEQEQLTKLLRDWSRGDRSALERLTPLIYNELRRLARGYMSREGPGHTLQPTALIGEAYIKLIEMPHPNWISRKHFYAATSKIMRHVLVDYAKKKRSIKRGGELKRVSLEVALDRPAGALTVIDLLVLDDALTQLGKIDPRKEAVIELGYFGGMTIEEIAETLDIATSTVNRDMDFGRAWLARALGSRKPS
jgi:RNA polymerase sigma factor (TIGR02999 family)